MRYREGEIPKDQLATHASDGMLIVSGLLGIVIGVILFFLGRFGKQMYLWVWGIGLVIIGAYLSLAIAFDWKLFKYF